MRLTETVFKDNFMDQRVLLNHKRLTHVGHPIPLLTAPYLHSFLKTYCLRLKSILKIACIKTESLAYPDNREKLICFAFFVEF